MGFTELWLCSILCDVSCWLLRWCDACLLLRKLITTVFLESHASLGVVQRCAEKLITTGLLSFQSIQCNSIHFNSIQYILIRFNSFIKYMMKEFLIILKFRYLWISWSRMMKPKFHQESNLILEPIPQP